MGGRKEKNNLDNCLGLPSIHTYDFFGFTDRLAPGTDTLRYIILFEIL